MVQDKTNNDESDGGETNEPIVYVVLRDLIGKDWTFGANVEGVYSTREAAEAHAGDIESVPGDEWAMVIEQTVWSEFANECKPEPVVMTDGGVDVTVEGGEVVSDTDLNHITEAAKEIGHAGTLLHCEIDEASHEHLEMRELVNDIVREANGIERLLRDLRSADDDDE